MRLIRVLLLIVFFHGAPGQLQAADRVQVESFEDVWRTVQATHFDLPASGVDWQEIYYRYRGEVGTLTDNDAFIRVVNSMLFELEQSHVLVASESMLRRRMPTLFSPGSIGLELRWLDGRAIVFRVKDGYPGHAAAIGPGAQLLEVDGIPVSTIRETAAGMPPYNERNKAGGLANYLMGHLDGESGTVVTLTYLDRDLQRRSITLTRMSRGDGRIISEAMPPVFVEFEAELLAENIGYVRFNHFAEPAGRRFSEACDRMAETRGLIVDVRGNPGGYFTVLEAIAGKLIGVPLRLYEFRMRDSVIDRYSSAAENPYRKPVVILIDETSMSSSELFASSLQSINRATVIGSRSPGYLIGAQWKRLPNDLSFMYPVLLPVPSNGYIVEDNGVIPDIAVALDRKSLQRGSDPQLEAAIRYLLEK